jgi:hypothetical protein
MNQIPKEIQKEYNNYRKEYKELSETDFWNTISGDKKLSPKFIEYFKDKLNWKNISEWQDLPEKLLLKYKNKIIWNRVRYFNYTFSDSFLQKAKNEVDWRRIRNEQFLSEKTEKKFQKYLKIEFVTSNRCNCHYNLK